jgi:pimeloyl-ACP methyl ester carboxylesterase
MEIDGYEILYYEGGEGDTLVLIHGFGDSMVSFLQTSAFLTEKYRVILPGV